MQLRVGFFFYDYFISLVGRLWESVEGGEDDSKRRGWKGRLKAGEQRSGGREGGVAESRQGCTGKPASKVTITLFPAVSVKSTFTLPS